MDKKVENCTSQPWFEAEVLESETHGGHLTNKRQDANRESAQCTGVSVHSSRCPMAPVSPGGRNAATHRGYGPCRFCGRLPYKDREAKNSVRCAYGMLMLVQSSVARRNWILLAVCYLSVYTLQSWGRKGESCEDSIFWP